VQRVLPKVQPQSQYAQNVPVQYQRNSVASSADASAVIRSSSSDVRADGFEYAYETSNDIRASARGDAYGNMRGEYEFTSPEGVHVRVNYIADENGYQADSDLLPTPPPIPDAILRSLEYIRTHPQYEENYKN